MRSAARARSRRCFTRFLCISRARVSTRLTTGAAGEEAGPSKEGGSGDSGPSEKKSDSGEKKAAPPPTSGARARSGRATARSSRPRRAGTASRPRRSGPRCRRRPRRGSRRAGRRRRRPRACRSSRSPAAGVSARATAPASDPKKIHPMIPRTPQLDAAANRAAGAERRSGRRGLRRGAPGEHREGGGVLLPADQHGLAAVRRGSPPRRQWSERPSFARNLTQPSCSS